MNVMWSEYPGGSAYSIITLDMLAELVHPLAAVYWDRDCADVGALSVANTLGGEPESSLRFIKHRKTGWTLAITGGLFDARLIAGWNDELMRWISGSEIERAAYAP